MLNQGRYEMRNSLEICEGRDICKEKSSTEENQSTAANFRPSKGEKDDAFKAVRTINAMESLKVLPVKYEQFLVANKR